MKKSLLMLLCGLPLIMSSCAMYKQEFECPPPCGVPCTSETDLESMIIETERGPDIFFPEKFIEPNCLSCDSQICSNKGKRVWMCEKTTEEGCCIEGHYIYLN